MGATTWNAVRPLLTEALDLPRGDRGRYLDGACVGDGPLRAKVEALLLAYDAGAEQLESPAPGGGGDGAGAEAMIGSRIGRYRVTGLIGYGGMGAVYEAEQDQPRRTVALKVMRPGLASRTALRRFELESQVLARLRHRGIAQIFEAGTHNSGTGVPARAVPYFAMEHIRGAAPITRFARDRSLPVCERLELFARVCDAVHHGHQQGVIHRDLKPSNILVDAEGEPKIIDFGVARALDAAGGTMATGSAQIVGTLQYMSPEQCAPGPEGIDTRSDVYALGVVLYELLAGRPPYDLSNASIPEGVRVIRETSPPPLGGISRALRGDIETIVCAAMEKDKARRYAAASDLASDLRRYLKGEPIAARPASAVYQLRVFAARHKPLAGAVAGVFLALVLGIVATSAALRSARAEAKRSQRIAEFFKGTITSGNPYLRSGLEGGPEWWEAPGDLRQGAPAESTETEGARGFSVPDMVTVAAGRLDAAFPDEPVTRAELADTLGLTLAHLGRGEEGRALLLRATETREQALGRDHLDTIRSRLRFAVRLEGSGAFAAAEPHFRAAWESCARALGATDPRTMAVGGRLALNLLWHKPREGLALARRNLAESVAAHGESHPCSLAQMAPLCGALLSSGEYAEAEQIARRILDGQRRTTGEGSFETAHARANLAGVVCRLGGFKEAEEQQRAALAVIRPYYAGDISRTMTYEIGLVTILRRMGRAGEAVVLTRRLLEAALAAFGPENHNVYKIETALARTMMEAGAEAEETERLARHASEGMVRVVGWGDLNTSLCADALNRAILARGRAGEAEGLARDLLRRAEAPGDTDPLLLLSLHATLGECLLDLGRPPPAEAHLVSAWRYAEDRTGPTFNDPYDPRRLGLLHDLVRLYEALKDAPKAAEYRAREPAGAAGH
jgi:hypothetical protein